MVTVMINTDGSGQIAYNYSGGKYDFSNSRPIQNANITIPANTDLTISARADDGYTFIGWKKDGENDLYSEDDMIVVTVKESSGYTAYFEPAD